MPIQNYWFSAQSASLSAILVTSSSTPAAVETGPFYSQTFPNSHFPFYVLWNRRSRIMNRRLFKIGFSARPAFASIFAMLDSLKRLP